MYVCMYVYLLLVCSYEHVYYVCMYNECMHIRYTHIHIHTYAHAHMSMHIHIHIHTLLTTLCAMKLIDIICLLYVNHVQSGKTALDFAKEKGHTDIVELVCILLSLFYSSIHCVICLLLHLLCTHSL